MQQRPTLPVAFLGLAFFVLAAVATASLLPGAEVKKWPPNPARHKITIERTAANDAEKKSIATAEAAYPAGKEKDKTWWQGEQLGLKLPFALTKEALDYYQAQVEAFGKKSWERYIEPSSSLSYQAKSAWHETFKSGEKTYEKVFVVSMQFRFSADFTLGATECVGFQKERKVILDSGGKVLAIEGDGPTEAPLAVI